MWSIKDRGNSRTAGVVVILLTALGVAAAYVIPGASGPTENGEPLAVLIAGNRPAPEDFVGSARCADCHAEIAAKYARHPMARSMSRVEDWLAATPLMTEVEFDPPGPSRYRVDLKGEQLVHEETQQVGDAVVAQQSRPVFWIIGSGQRGRAFATAEGEVLRQSPIGWYAHDPHWDLSPGYDTPDQPRFQRRITTGCLTCHAGQVAARGPNRFDAERPFVEMTIGCERCHGPGADHAAWHEQAHAPKVPDPIVNPGKLDPVRREAVCNVCHLSGVQHVLHAGLTDADFQPGRRLGDVWTVFVNNIGDRSDVPAVSQVQQMRASRCFQASNGRLGCISCHDPHEVPSREDRVSYYRERCQTCHDPEHQDCSVRPALRVERGDDCVGCHMPRSRSSNIPHTAQSDHRIPRRPDEETDQQIVGMGGPLTLWDEGLPRLDAATIERAQQILAANAAPSLNDVSAVGDACVLLQRIVAGNPQDGRAWEALARAATRADQFTLALSAGRQACELLPEDDGTWRVLAAAAIAAQDWQTADQALDQSLELVPDEAESWELAAFVRMQQGRLQEAQEAASLAVELDPARPLPHAYLADALLQLQQPAEGRRHFELFRRLRETSQPKPLGGLPRVDGKFVPHGFEP